MNFWGADNLKTVTGGRWLVEPRGETSFAGVSTDTRTLKPGQVFVALRGERFDAHDHLQQAVDTGAALLIVDREDSAASLPGKTPTLVVGDTLASLSQLAAAYRRTLAAKVVAVTGSVGKTSTKQLIDAVLRARFKGSASPKSFNNSVGVPLTILAAEPDDAYLVVEIGTNAPGEVAALAAIAEPDVAVITNIGAAHLEGLGGIDGVFNEKTSILNHLREGGIGIVCTDSYRLTELARDTPNIFTYGHQITCDLWIVSYEADAAGSTFKLMNGQKYRIPLLGEHNAVNALAAIYIGRHMGLTQEQIAAGLAATCAPQSRLNIRRFGPATAPLLLIDDCYNANPESMASSLAVLAHYPKPAAGRRIAILGDMLELGQRGPELHRALGEQVSSLDVDAVLFVGRLSLFGAEAAARNWPQNRVHAFPSITDAAAAQVAALLRPGDVVLLKASRGMALERLIPAIESHLNTKAMTPA
jgi:UDP-N-acetylmuramoyl-tripeptide--D-alanyl-D-alanine ligase